MSFRSLILASAAGCALAVPGSALAADLGTLTFSWNGSEFTYAPTSFASANAGDTVTLTRTDSQINEFPVLYNGSGAFTVTNPNGGPSTNSCTGSPSAGGTFSFSECYVTGANSTVLTVVTPGTLQVWSGVAAFGSTPSLVAKLGDVNIGGGATPSPTPAATPATTTAAVPTPPPPTAQLLRSPTTQNTKASNRIGCSQVSVPLQLDKVGRYTFIYERSTGQSASARESQVTSTTRVTWNKGSTLGKRKLSKASTAPVLVTTEANKRLVVNGLIKKAQAKNLRLRVIHTAADGTLTQDVFDAE